MICGNSNCADNEAKKTVKLIIFLVMMGMLLSVTNFVLAQKEAKNNMYALRYEKSDTIDIIFCGVGCLLFLFLTSCVLKSIEKPFLQYQGSYWRVYKDYFEATIVPVSRWDTCFGTIADNLTIYYTEKYPGDCYGSSEPPYKIVQLDDTIDTIGECVSSFDLDSIEGALSAVYLNYPSNVGNAELLVHLYNKSGDEIGYLNQISPLSSKTIGFILDEKVYDVANIKVSTKSGECAFVESRAYFVYGE